MCFWHTFRGDGRDIFGAPTIQRPWDDGSNSIVNAKRRVQVAFEFLKRWPLFFSLIFIRLGVDYYTFHDRDVAPEGKNLKETNENLEEITSELEKLQKETGIKLLWGTANLFSHPVNTFRLFTISDT